MQISHREYSSDPRSSPVRSPGRPVIQVQTDQARPALEARTQRTLVVGLPYTELLKPASSTSHSHTLEKSPTETRSPCYPSSTQHKCQQVLLVPITGRPGRGPHLVPSTKLVVLCPSHLTCPVSTESKIEFLRRGSTSSRPPPYLHIMQGTLCKFYARNGLSTVDQVDCIKTLCLFHFVRVVVRHDRSTLAWYPG